MDWQSVVVLAIVIFALIWLVMRLRGRSRNPGKLQITMGLISNINDDLKILNSKKNNPQNMQKFKVGGWNSYQEHLSFLEPETVTALKDTFTVLTDYNTKIEAVRNAPGMPLPEISLDSVRESMIKGRAGLATWIQQNINREATRGMFGWR
jgi:hypothetical protein